MNDVWLSVQEVSDLLDVSKQAVKKNCKNVKYITKMVDGNGGKQYRIYLQSLGPEAVSKYYGSIPAAEILEDEEDLQMDVALEYYEQAPHFNRKQFDKYIAIIKASEGLAGQELKAFIKKWNNENPEMKSCYARVLDARKTLKQRGAPALLGNYGNKAGNTVIEDHLYNYFEKMYLTEKQNSIKSCWKATLGFAKDLNKELKVADFPTAEAFIYQLRRKVPQDVILLEREGYAKWNKKWNNYIDRDYTNIQPGEIWVSDHRQIDQAVRNEITDKKFRETLDDWFEKNQNAFVSRHNKITAVFPWITVWRDMLTGKWLGWNIHIEDPNTDYILDAFFKAARKYGIPKTVYLDNGKDYRSKDFAGGRTNKVKVTVDEVKVRSLTAMLGIDVKFAIPYNAQAKPIERDFKDYKEMLDKKFPGYRGGNVIERPESLVDELKKKDGIVKLGEYIHIMEYFIEEILHKKQDGGKVHNGRSRNQTWIEETNYFINQGVPSALRKVREDDLKMFCMRMSGDHPIKRNGVVLSQKHGLYYWGNWMYGCKGEYVYLRRDNKKYQEAWVFRSSNDEYLGKATLNAFSAAVIAKTDIEKKQLQEVLHNKNMGLKIAKSIGDNDLQVSAFEQLKHHAMGIGALTEDVPEVKPISAKNAQIYYMNKMTNVVTEERYKQAINDDIILGPLHKIIEEDEDWV